MSDGGFHEAQMNNMEMTSVSDEKWVQCLLKLSRPVLWWLQGNGIPEKCEKHNPESLWTALKHLAQWTSLKQITRQKYVMDRVNGCSVDMLSRKLNSLFQAGGLLPCLDIHHYGWFCQLLPKVIKVFKLKIHNAWNMQIQTRQCVLDIYRVKRVWVEFSIRRLSSGTIFSKGVGNTARPMPYLFACVLEHHSKPFSGN